MMAPTARNAGFGALLRLGRRGMGMAGMVVAGMIVGRLATAGRRRRGCGRRRAGCGALVRRQRDRGRLDAGDFLDDAARRRRASDRVRGARSAGTVMEK